jgi:uncharacterized membrane protein YtjA (UPF0391 family)
MDHNERASLRSTSKLVDWRPAQREDADRAASPNRDYPALRNPLVCHALHALRPGEPEIGTPDASHGVRLGRGKIERTISAAFSYEEIDMLYWAMVFLVIALIAGFLGFTGVYAAAAGIAKILFFVFLILFIVSLISGGFSRRTIP